MFAEPGPFDLIWCAAAAYFAGIETSLRRFASILAPGGAIAFSEVVWQSDDRPQVLADFWKEYGEMTDLAGTRDRIAAADFSIVGERILSDTAWANYYDPISDRIALLERGPVNADLAEVLEEQRVEIQMRGQYPRHFDYALFVVRPR